jgi:anaerobic selenocysteine-containing dehydrogenase
VRQGEPVPRPGVFARPDSPSPEAGREKGEGKFEQISWDEALDTIAANFKRVIADHGPQSILPYSYAGNSGMIHYGSLDRRLFASPGRLGTGSHHLRLGRLRGVQSGDGRHHRLRSRESREREAHHRLGRQHHLVQRPLLALRREAAKKKGARLIVIDPYRSKTAEKADWHIAPLPGTDGALAFAMMNVLFRDGLTDHDYIEPVHHRRPGPARTRERVDPGAGGG